MNTLGNYTGIIEHGQVIPVHERGTCEHHGVLKAALLVAMTTVQLKTSVGVESSLRTHVLAGEEADNEVRKSLEEEAVAVSN